MANPRDPVAPTPAQAGEIDPVFLNGEYFLDERTGRTMIKVPAGGSGGGVTSYAVQPATEEQHVGYLKSLADQKKAEHENLEQQHQEADEKLQERQADAKDGEAPAPEANNPITAETYGRPPQHVPATNQQGPENPADQRDYVDNQPVSEKPAQGDPNQPLESAKQPNPNEPTQGDPNKPFYKPDPLPAA